MSYIPESLREHIIERARGRCEYCLIHQEDAIYSHEVDHIIPYKHRGTTEAENLCYSCADCNRHKGSDFASIDPDTQEIVRLFNPREQVWGDHFRLDGGLITPISPVGYATVFVLKMNDEMRVGDRQLLVAEGLYPRE